MEHAPQKRVLLVSGDSTFAKDFHEIGTAAGWAEELTAPSDSASVWETVSSTLGDLEIETVDDLAAAQSQISLGLKERRPYYLLAVDLDSDNVLSNAAAFVDQAWYLDALLLVVFFSENLPAACEAIVDELGSLDGYFFLPKPLERVQTSQLLAAQLDRRVTRDRMLVGAMELDSARRRLDCATHVAEEAEHFKAQFMANVSHEIRTPMHAILGFSRLLMREGLNSRQRERVQHVHDAGSGLARLIDNILDFSKLAEGKLKLSSLDFDLGTVLADVLNTTRPAAQEKGLSMHGHAPKSIPRWLRGDRSRFRQILTNLIDNAIKFTKQGSIHVHTTLDEETESLVTLRTVVTDTGVGIPPERHAIVFESFAQADGSATRSFEGLGLGLTICKRLVDLMGGQIGFRSTPGEGSSFWFTTVFRKQTPGELQPGRSFPTEPDTALLVDLSRPETGDDPRTQAAKCRVLAVDDNSLERTLIEALLTRAGCIVDLVANVEEALAVLMNNSYDLALINTDPRKTDFLEAMHRLRREQDAQTRPAAIVVLTDQATDDERRACVKAGADDLLAKPLASEELFQTIGRLLPGFLESLEDTPAPPDAASNNSTQKPETVPGCMASIRAALDAHDFPRLEERTLALKALATRDGYEIAADQSMRLLFAARGKHSDRALTAVNQLEETLATVIVPGPLSKTPSRTCR